MAVTLHLPHDGRAWLRPTLSPMTELGTALHVLTAPDHHLGLTSWATRIRDTFTPRMEAEANAFQFLWDSHRATFMLPLDPGNRSEEPRRTAGLDAVVTTTFEHELAAIAAMPLDRFAVEALQPLGSRPVQPTTAGRADGDDLLLANARARNRRVEALTAALLQSPDEVRARLLAFLSACRDTFFATEWARMEPTLRGAVADLVAQRDERDPTSVLLGLAHGITRRGRTIVVDKAYDATIDLRSGRDLLVVPSLLCHPHVLVQADAAWPHVVQYPVHRRAPRRDLPSLATTARRLEALADPSRMELCTLIAREARATQELASMTGLSTPTVSRHLKVLRDAGLVTSSQHGHFRLHELDLEVVEGLGSALVASLLR